MPFFFIPIISIRDNSLPCITRLGIFHFFQLFMQSSPFLISINYTVSSCCTRPSLMVSKNRTITMTTMPNIIGMIRLISTTELPLFPISSPPCFSSFNFLHRNGNMPQARLPRFSSSGTPSVSTRCTSDCYGNGLLICHINLSSLHILPAKRTHIISIMFCLFQRTCLNLQG